MKLLRKALLPIAFAVIYGSTLTCAGQQSETGITFQEQAPFKVSPVYFQEWYAGIKVGGTGINIFLPIKDIAENVKIEEVFFRNLQGELFEKDGKYHATLKNKSPHYTFKKSEAPADYPFTLKDDECVVSYLQNDELKFLKLIVAKEVAGTYYENGPPTIYTRASSSGVATVDEEELTDDN